MTFDGKEHAFPLGDDGDLLEAVNEALEGARGMVFGMGIPVTVGIQATRPHVGGGGVDLASDVHQCLQA